MPASIISGVTKISSPPASSICVGLPKIKADPICAIKYIVADAYVVHP